MSAACQLPTTSGRLLIAEDEPMMSAALKRVLAAEGHHVTTVSNGADALSLLVCQSFDAVVSDITMPKLDGIGLLTRLRERNVDIPVILITGAPSLDTARKGIEYKAFHYLPKPFDLDELCGVVARAVEKTKSPVQADLSERFDRFLDGLWMAFQPVVHRTGKLFGYEALLRGREPSLPHPGAVLEAAEELGQLETLGRKIRQRTAQDFAEGPPDTVLFFNLHPVDFMDPHLYDRHAPLSQIASRVVLEVTERLSLKSIPDLESRIVELRSMGYRLAVDDLGFGYAGLTSLVLLNPEIVKLDMSLVRDVEQHANQRSIIHSVLNMRETFGFSVVAEGIETQSERDTLVQMGCDLFQGYLIGRPAAPFPATHWP